jgi:hypothetical protein
LWFVNRREILIRKYVFGWFGLLAVAVLNGVLRELLFKPHVGDLITHQISVLVLRKTLAVYVFKSNVHHPMCLAGNDNIL